jgi:hypothetical protein
MSSARPLADVRACNVCDPQTVMKRCQRTSGAGRDRRRACAVRTREPRVTGSHSPCGCFLRTGSPSASRDASDDNVETRVSIRALVAVRPDSGDALLDNLHSCRDAPPWGQPAQSRTVPCEPQRFDLLLVGLTTYGKRSASQNPRHLLFSPPVPAVPAPRGRCASKNSPPRVRRYRFAPDGLGGVSLPMTVSPSQGIGLCVIKGDRP